MMRYLKVWALVLLAFVMAACGGGGNPGSSGSGGTGTTGGTTVSSSSVALDVLNGAGSSATAISTVEIGVARATVKTANGTPIKGVIVTFTGGALLTISPISATALTDDNGQASVEIRAASTSSQGAVSIGVSAAISSALTVTASKAIQITAAPATGNVDPQILANALNFLDTSPSDKSIVLAGSGGNGRSESATLRFRVVDKNNSPVKGALIDFTVSPANVVALNIVSATSDSDGVVVTTVSSRNVATAVVVRATVNGRAITSQSDQLLVTTGAATQAGFDLSASKYSMNLGISGDTSEIIVRIADANGNPVADGVPVAIVANYGSVATSAMGGCLTVNGTCKVVYTVQNPRPPDGENIVVTAFTQLASGETIGEQLSLTATDPVDIKLFETQSASAAAITEIDLVGSCSKSFTYYAGTAKGLPAPRGTVVSMQGVGVGGTVAIGSPTGAALDHLRTALTFTVAVSTTATASPPCVAGGAVVSTVQMQVKFSADNRDGTKNITVKYPS